MVRPVLLIIRDGCGYNKNATGNAVAAANTPNDKEFREKYPWMLIDACGENVGLPAGYQVKQQLFMVKPNARTFFQQGNSEVGHLSMGSGRVIKQELKLIFEEMENGNFWKTENFMRLAENWIKNKSQFHLCGLLQDEGVHAHEAHLYAIMDKLRSMYPEGRIVVHPFMDGRDTPPRSCELFVKRLLKKVEEIGHCQIGAVMGRYYGMDRNFDWPLTSKGYNAIVSCEGEKLGGDFLSIIQKMYDTKKTPDGVDMYDEYIPPFVLDGYEGMKDGDSFLHTNYRQDRAIQLSMCFANPEKTEADMKFRPKITFAGLTKYYDEFEYFILPPLGSSVTRILSEILSENGIRQLRIAETQKYRHVTSFFNGKRTTPYPNEKWEVIKGRFDVSEFAQHPEMEAYIVTEKLLERIEEANYDFYVVNYANCDMVGHTGNFEAAKKAVEIVDECVGKVTRKMLEKDGRILITADHGNADQMVYYTDGGVMTSHTLNPVTITLVSKEAEGKKVKLTSHEDDVEHIGKLSDISPTILHLFGLEAPKEMTSASIIKE